MEQLQRALVKAAEETVLMNKTRRHIWWNKECEAAVNQRQSAWQTWNQNKNVKNKTIFTEQRKLTSKIIRNVKRTFEKSQLSRIEEDFKKNNVRDFYRIFKNSIRKYSPPSLHLKDTKGQIAFNDYDNCRILAEYFESLLNCEPQKERFIFKETTDCNPDSLPPTKEEIEKIIQSLKNNKAPGEDLIIAELWKHVNNKTLDKLTELMSTD